MEIRKLKPREFAGLAGVFNKVFNSDTPSPEHADVIGVFDNGRLEAFLSMERIIMIDQVWSRTPKNNAHYIKSLVRYVRENTPDRQTVATMSDGKRFEILFRLLGFQRIAGTFFRRNSK